MAPSSALSAPPPKAVGVLGAGTMGAGIAQLAATAGMQTWLYDPVPEALDRGQQRIKDGLGRMVDKQRISRADADSALERVKAVSDVGALADSDLVIEAATENLTLKLELFAAIEEVVGRACVLATNTSSLSVSEIAASLSRPSRVVGLHFFNPAPVMRLVEVVAGQASDPDALAIARSTGLAMGKRVINAADIPGFIVNRCNRPYFLEALRLLESRVATIEQIDRIARLGGGFRMGPFELMDLIGNDTNHAVAQGLYKQSFGEPRYQPSFMQERLIAVGRLGRKTGAGWYDYPDGETARASDPQPLAPHGGAARELALIGNLPITIELSKLLRGVGFAVTDGHRATLPWLTLVCGDADLRPDGPRARLLVDGSLHGLDPEAAGFHVLPPLANTRLMEVTTTRRTNSTAYSRLCELATALGWHYEHVADAPGLVLGRIVGQLINEAAFLIGAGNGTPADIDAGMELGVNHPRGPATWSEKLGLRHVVSVLDALAQELGEDRYRVAPVLRQGLAIGQRGLGRYDEVAT